MFRQFEHLSLMRLSPWIPIDRSQGSCVLGPGALVLVFLGLGHRLGAPRQDF